MKRSLAVVAIGILALAIVAPPALATTTRISITCTEARLTDWTGGREWVDEAFVYHTRNRAADYRDSGHAYCNGVNHAVTNVNLDLLTGEGIVWADGDIVLDGIAGGWDAHLVAHFTPGGPYIWEGVIVGHGWGALDGYQLRGTLMEPTHEDTIANYVVSLPGD